MDVLARRRNNGASEPALPTARAAFWGRRPRPASSAAPGALRAPGREAWRRSEKCPRSSEGLCSCACFSPSASHGPPRGGRRPPGDLPGGEEVVPGEDLRRQKLWFHHYDRTVALLCHRRRQLSQRGVATFYHESPQAAAARQFHRRCTTSRRCSTASGPGASDASRPRAPRGARPPEVSPAAGHRSGAERLEARAPEWPPAPRSQGSRRQGRGRHRSCPSSRARRQLRAEGRRHDARVDTGTFACPDPAHSCVASRFCAIPVQKRPAQCTGSGRSISLPSSVRPAAFQKPRQGGGACSRCEK
ncbi:unnamed protein product, partial [Prorocentrum cordatum]